MNHFQRARSAQQKDVRINQIMDAAVKLYNDMPYEKITLAGIAGELCFTRANLYKYVSSKEEIFLKIIERDTQEWISDLSPQLNGISGMALPEFAKIWTASLFRHKRLIELISILYSVIEKNVTVEKLAEFKVGFMAEMESIVRLIQGALPALTFEQGNTFLMMQSYYSMGLYPAAAQSDVQKKAVEISGVSYVAPDFESSLFDFIIFTLEGLLKKS